MLGFIASAERAIPDPAWIVHALELHEAQLGWSMEGRLERGRKELNKMQGLRRKETLIERPAERAGGNQLKME